MLGFIAFFFYASSPGRFLLHMCERLASATPKEKIPTIVQKLIQRMCFSKYHQFVRNPTLSHDSCFLPQHRHDGALGIEDALGMIRYPSDTISFA
jgi:hypothetical protein